MARRSDEELFLEALPLDGKRRGNYDMMTELGWKEEKYWRVRDRLVSEGKLVIGRGQGGSVARADVTSAESKRGSAKGTSETFDQEFALYPLLLDTLKNQWGKFKGLNHFDAAVTAAQGRRQTGGTWTRPDITGLSVRRFPYVQGVHFDLWTFEVKPAWQVTVTGVFEAAAHSKFATRPFVMFHVPDEEPPEFARCVDEATRFGIGLITFSSPTEFSSWEIHVDAIRRSPNPEDLNEFIATQLSVEMKEQLHSWLM